MNQSFVDEHFAGEDPLGRRIRTREGPEASGDWRLVVGVVPDLMMQGLDQVSRRSADGVYVPAVEADGLPSNLLLRARGEPLDLVAPVRELARSIRPDLSIFEARSLPEALRQSTWYVTLTARVFIAFGAVALVLASVGLLSLVAAESERRRQEVGVRMALGARAADIVRLIVGLGLRHMALGVAVGILLAAGLSRAMAVVLFRTSPTDPGVYAAAVGVVIAIGVATCLVPAYRAAGVDPVRSLRSE